MLLLKGLDVVLARQWEQLAEAPLPLRLQCSLSPDVLLGCVSLEVTVYAAFLCL